MTRPKERDERSHGEGYPGSPDPDAETEEDRYGLKPDPDRGRDSRDEKAPPPSPDRRRAS
jgi:hypothetical protein